MPLKLQKQYVQIVGILTRAKGFDNFIQSLFRGISGILFEGELTAFSVENFQIFH